VNDRKDRTPPERHLIPIEGLKVPCAWRVGRVTLHPGSSGEELLREAPPFETEKYSVRDEVESIIASARDSAIADVPGRGDIDAALDDVRSSLDVLRLFQASRSYTQTTVFGLPGDIYRSKIDYVSVWLKGSAPGWSYRGDHVGWTFTAELYDDWVSSSAFQFLDASLRDPSATESAQRAVIGAQLLARAVVEHRPDLKMLSVASALEAWLLERQAGPQTLRLARYASWFGCGQHNNDLCGRDRPICPYLHLSPNDKRDRERLRTLRELGGTNVRWRCSEWHRLMDWYDARSDAAHGAPVAVDTRFASSAEYWATHYLMEPILDWLREHPGDPVGDLETEVNAIADPDGWQAMLVALDSPRPPSEPPLPHGNNGD
jgi:hypothetical protein